MRRALVFVNEEFAGSLEEQDGAYTFRYAEDYVGTPVSLTMPISQREFTSDGCPAFFEGLLPEGEMLEGLLRQRKIDRNDLFAQLVAVGSETVGAVTIAEDIP